MLPDLSITSSSPRLGISPRPLMSMYTGSARSTGVPW